MKKIVLYVFILVLPAIIAFLGLNFAYKQTNFFKSTYNNTDRFNHVPDRIQLCNVGTSHGCFGIKWEDYPGLNAFNFAQTSQPFYMDLIMLKHFEKKIAEDAIVLIPLSFHQVYKYWQYSYIGSYYLFLSKQEIPSWSLQMYITKAALPIFDNMQLSAYIFKDIPTNKIDRFHYQERWTSCLSEGEMQELIDEHSMQWFVDGFNENSYQKNFNAVSAIVDYCYEQNYIPIFITVPVYEDFNQAFDKFVPFIKKGFYKFSSELCEKYPNVPYWDYSNDKDFSSNIELFMDDDHLNMYGAEKFTARIIEDLKKAGYLQ